MRHAPDPESRASRGALAWEILKVALPGSVNTILTNANVMVVTSLVGAFGTLALAGYGAGARLEYLQIPLIFGMGTALVTMVGMNVGAGQAARARRVALTGAGLAAAMTGSVGLLSAIVPSLWIGFFSVEPGCRARSAATYSRIVGPTYAFFGRRAGALLRLAGDRPGALVADGRASPASSSRRWRLDRDPLARRRPHVGLRRRGARVRGLRPAASSRRSTGRCPCPAGRPSQRSALSWASKKAPPDAAHRRPGGASSGGRGDRPCRPPPARTRSTDTSPARLRCRSRPVPSVPRPARSARSASRQTARARPRR